MMAPGPEIIFKQLGSFLWHSKFVCTKLPAISLIKSGTLGFTVARRFSQTRSRSFCFQKSTAPTLGTSDSVIPLFRRGSSGDRKMGYFVIGVSGVTCGGKTTVTKLLLRKFPWAQVIHQDHYFYLDDNPQLVRVPEAENHVNYEILEALDMSQMYKDVQAILDAPPKFSERAESEKQQETGVGDKAETPNFDEDFFLQIPDIQYDVSKYEKVPILIIEGFTIYASQFLYDVCDVRFFFTLEKQICKERRSKRSYFPPDSTNYFEIVVWPEYLKHCENYVNKRSGVNVIDDSILITDIWETTLQIIACRIEEKLKNGESIITDLTNVGP